MTRHCLIAVFSILFICGFRPAQASESEVTSKPSHLEFDELTFTQAGRELFTEERVTIPFPVAYDSDSAHLEPFFYILQPTIDTDIAYRAFPGALLGFPQRSEFERQWQEFAIGEGGFRGNSFFVFIGGMSVLANSRVLDNPSVPAEEKEKSVHAFRLLDFFIHLDAWGESDFRRMMEWYDAIDRAMELRKPIVITFRLVFASAQKEENKISDLSLWGFITNIRVDE